MKKLNLILLSFVVLLTACGTDTTTENVSDNPIPRDPSAVKEVEFFTYMSDTADIGITKIADINSENTVNISPEVPGRITSLKVNIGDSVEKGQLIATLGESLSTSSSAIQASSADKLKEISDASKYNTEVAGNISLQNAVLIAEQSYTTLLQLQDSKLQTEENIEYQLENAELEIDNANLAKEALLEQIDDLEVRIWDLEDDQKDIFLDIRDNDSPELEAGLQAQYEALESQIDTLQGQLDNLEISVDQSRNRIEQAQIAFEQLQLNAQIQIDQISNSINSAMIQYDQALVALAATEKQAQLQDLAAESQNVQADQSEKLSNLNISAQNIYAPADGVISDVLIKEGSLINPGQNIATLSAEHLIVKAYLTEDEVNNIKIGQQVTLGNEYGKITSINKVANSQNERFTVEITPSSDTKLTSGTQIEVSFDNSSLNFIPLNAVVIDGNTYRVKTLTDQNRIQYKTFEAGEINGSYIEVLSGLDPNEKVVTSTELFLEEGERVNLK